MFGFIQEFFWNQTMVEISLNLSSLRSTIRDQVSMYVCTMITRPPLLLRPPHHVPTAPIPAISKETISLLRPLHHVPTTPISSLPKETTSLLRPLHHVPTTPISSYFNLPKETTSLLRPLPPCPNSTYSSYE